MNDIRVVTKENEIKSMHTRSNTKKIIQCKMMNTQEALNDSLFKLRNKKDASTKYKM